MMNRLRGVLTETKSAAQHFTPDAAEQQPSNITNAVNFGMPELEYTNDVVGP